MSARARVCEFTSFFLPHFLYFYVINTTIKTCILISTDLKLAFDPWKRDTFFKRKSQNFSHHIAYIVLFMMQRVLKDIDREIDSGILTVWLLSLNISLLFFFFNHDEENVVVYSKCWKVHSEWVLSKLVLIDPALNKKNRAPWEFTHRVHILKRTQQTIFSI